MWFLCEWKLSTALGVLPVHVFRAFSDKSPVL